MKTNMVHTEVGLRLWMWRNSFLLIVKLLKSIMDRLGIDEPLISDILPVEDDSPLESGLWGLDSASFVCNPNGRGRNGRTGGWWVQGSMARSSINVLAWRKACSSSLFFCALDLIPRKADVISDFLRPVTGCNDWIKSATMCPAIL